MAILFSEQTVKARLTNKLRLKSFIKNLFQREGQGVRHLQYVFCTDAFLLEINKQFLQHDTYTDIVTFELSDDPLETEGEIYISVDRVKENADQYNTSYERELHRVIFHGALHLCGFGDKSEEESNIMREKEEEYLNLYFPVS
ncbi:rRNA maturation RNase YbeY [Chitinophaga costaii]|uniref:Endoribonuclease YbeY n=1 Tax=Chitinophaga costaii TaxID=1335309 RepID=A0A1C4AHZ6_9BACT|nr:rRNA maturation RNase YbeY [Chitinophaga costaii]PUZ26608.1 rRNA maturation RNase YbeY [Chitinophaga costaii]SCB94139.1 rRNA maturation RNase YbeY [Chitinophaga costaii]